jgi:hypothetical protein
MQILSPPVMIMETLNPSNNCLAPLNNFDLVSRPAAAPLWAHVKRLISVKSRFLQIGVAAGAALNARLMETA